MAALLALALACLSSLAAAACDACSGRETYTTSAATVAPAPLSVAALTDCACEWVFAYASGPALGQVTINLSGDVGSLSVYGDTTPLVPLAFFASSDDLEDTVVFSSTGVIRVVFTSATPAPANPGAIVFSIASTAINQAPVLTPRDDIPFAYDPNTNFEFIRFPWDVDQPLPVTCTDNDNMGTLRAQITLESNAPLGLSEPQVAIRVPAVPDVTFLVGSPGTLIRRAVFEGPAAAVILAVDNTILRGTSLSRVDYEDLTVTVSDGGDSGSGGVDLSSTISYRVFPYPSGVVNVNVGTMLHSGYGAIPVDNNVYAVFLVPDAYFLDVTDIRLEVGDPCNDYIRVYDGPDLDNARLLSTELALTGEICAPLLDNLPDYISSTGSFVVELFTSPDEVSLGFDALYTPIPDGFQVWPLDGALELSVASGQELVLSQIMVTDLPVGANNVTVSASATEGTIVIRLAESFADLIDPTAPAGSVSVSHTDTDLPVMLRMGDVLRQFSYVAPAGFTGTDTITVVAASGSSAHATLEISVVVSPVAINAPATLALNAFRPVPVPVTVSRATQDDATVTVSTAAGFGRVSADPRATDWLEVGYGSEITVTDAQLPYLVYRADLGGADTITITTDGVEHVMQVDVNPECFGDYLVYGREVSITERAGPPQDPYTSDADCTWAVFGPRVMRFAYNVLSPRTLFGVADGVGTSLYFHPFFTPPVLRSSTGFFPFFRGFIDFPGGFVATFEPNNVNDPPIIVAPSRERTILRGTTAPLSGLYVNDFDPGAIRIVISTDRGSLSFDSSVVVPDNTTVVSASGAQIEYTAPSFEAVDTLLTSVNLAAGDEQGLATVTLYAQDEGGAADQVDILVSVLPCTGLVELSADSTDITSRVTVSDGSLLDSYASSMACSWRLTGAPAPAVLDVQFLAMEERDGTCVDGVSVWDGASSDGRFLGTFCSLAGLAQVGSLVSQTGSFFIFAFSDEATEDDGFSFEYGPLESTGATSIGAIPVSASPFRSDASIVALDADTFVVVGGASGSRAVLQPLLFSTASGWAVLDITDPAPSPRQQAAATALSASSFLLHGGTDAAGVVVRDTWQGTVDASTGSLSWTLLAETGPATSSAFLFVQGGVPHLVESQDGSVWALDAGAWSAALAPSRMDGAPVDLLPLSGALDPLAGAVYAVDALGAVWKLETSPAVGWTEVAATAPEPCTASGFCAGAMLGDDEYLLFADSGAAHGLNTTTLEWTLLTVEGQEISNAASRAIGGTYHGRPAAFVLAGGSMSVLALQLGISTLTPRVSPIAGGTVLTVSGERLSECVDAFCAFGADAATAPTSVATILSERTLVCTTPADLDAGAFAVRLGCADVDVASYRTVVDVVAFDGPTIASVDPAVPFPGELMRIQLGDFDTAVLAPLITNLLCFFGDVSVEGQLTTENVEQPEIQCQVPDTIERGSTVPLRVSLDGQQGSGTTFNVEIEAELVSEGESTGSGSDSSLVIIVASGVAGFTVVLLAFGLVRYRKLAAAVAGPAPWEIRFEDIELYGVIGAGAYGAVHRGIYRGGEVAVKVIKEGAATDDMIESFKRESALMAELRHPNIVLFMGACTTFPNIAIVLEYLAQGSLYDLIHNDRAAFRATERTMFALDIAKGMEYLHAANPPIVHRDLKSLNVLVDKNWTLKVSDFGLTEIFAEAPRRRKVKGRPSRAGDSGSVSARSGYLGSLPAVDSGGYGYAGTDGTVGSVQWTAPEVLRGAQADRASDVYSFGVTFWEICTRDEPYTGFLPAAVVSRVVEQPKDPEQLFRPKSTAHISNVNKTIIERCWAESPSDRPTFSELRELLATAEEGDPTEKSEASSEVSATYIGSIVSDIPSSGDLFVVAIRIPDYDRLWASDPTHMRVFMGVYIEAQQHLARRTKAYTAISDQSQTVYVFGLASDALRFAVELQEALMKASWPMLGEGSSLSHLVSDESDLYTGLRVSCGVSHGPVERRVDKLTRRTEFEGETLVRSVQIAEAATGGQILVQQSVLSSVDVNSVGGVALEHETLRMGDVSAVYPQGLRARHNQGANDTSGQDSQDDAGGSLQIAEEHLEVGELIGAGTYGTVYKGVLAGRGEVACKLLHRKRLGREGTLDLRMEVGVASSLEHPNVCKFLGVCVLSTGRVLLVTDFMPGGSLQEAVVLSSRRISDPQKFRIARDIAMGLSYLHSQKPVIVHRAMSSRNVLLTENWKAMISDFGLARTKSSNHTMSKITGGAYTAPELLRGDRSYGEKVDVYALGIIMWELLEQTSAYSARPMKIGMLVRAVLAGLRPDSDRASRTGGELTPYVELMQSCWDAESEKRPSAAEVLDKLQVIVPGSMVEPPLINQ